MQKLNLLDEIKRIKSTTKPVSKRAKQQQQRLNLQKTLSQAFIIKNRTISFKSESKILAPSSQTSSTNSSNSKQKHYNFNGATFYFPMRDIELTNKRVQIFQSIIKKRGGIVVPNQQAYKKGVKYVVSTTKISKFVLLQNLERLCKGKKQNILWQKIINYHYIIDCQKQFVCLPTTSYELYKNQEYIANVINKNDTIHELGQPRKLRHVDEKITDDQCQQAMSSTVSISNNFKSKYKAVQKIEYAMTQKKQLSTLPPSSSFIYQIDKQKFACQKGSSISQFSVNQYIYEQLMKFYNIYESQKDTGRKIAYLKAAFAIKSFHKQIQSEKDIVQLRGIGKKIQKKIKELLQTGQIQKLQKLQQNQQTLICQQLSRVWGIGTAKAKQLYLKGIKSIEMLKSRQQLLNKNQVIGLKYVDQFQQRIPRHKVKQIFEFVRGRLCELVGSQTKHLIQVCGSYRRGKQTCGDIDIIITRKDGIYQQSIIIDLINKLERQGFLTDHLSIPSKKDYDSHKSISYMGVCTFESEVHHRIDIKYYPIQQYAFAILYFTGSDMFNRSMRLFARKKGYSLSDHGITQVQRNNNNQKIWKGEQIQLYSEQDIFQFLGLDFKTPQQRNI